jgi:hypothetical protein
MGIIHKKKPPVILQKGTIEDNKGQKFNVDFVGDDNDFVNISYIEEKKADDSIKILLKQNENQIHDICFINNYSNLLVGCDKGLLYVYKRINNNKSNLKFEEVTHFKLHEKSIIQIIKLQSGLILTLCSDSSCKIINIEIETNDILYENEQKYEEIQTLLDASESGNNSAIELESGNLIISQGFFINFFEKNTNGMSMSESLMSITSLNSIKNKEYHLSKKIFTNSDNIFFTEIDPKTIAASQISSKILLFYNVEDYSLIKSINKIEFSENSNCMCLINKETLAIGGNNGSIYLVNTIMKQLFLVTHFENCNNISSIKSIDDQTVIMGCQCWDTNFDVIIYKVENNKFQEVKRKQKTHDGVIKDIKLITMDISKNQNPFTDRFNIISLGLDYKVKLLLDKSN